MIFICPIAIAIQWHISKKTLVKRYTSIFIVISSIKHDFFSPIYNGPSIDNQIEYYIWIGDELWLVYGAYPMEIAFATLNSHNDEGFSTVDLAIR